MKLIYTHLLTLLINLLSQQPQYGQKTATVPFSTNDCVLTKIIYSPSKYDIPTYDSRGLITSVQSYANGAKTALYTHDFDNDGKLISQNLNGLHFRYDYEGDMLTKIQLLDPTSQGILGEYGVSFDAAGRIGTLTVQNTASLYKMYEGYNSTFTYDSLGNCTIVDLKDNQGRVVSRTVCSDFVPIQSHVTLFKNHYINPFTASVTENLQFPLLYKQPNTCPNHVEVYSAFSSTGAYTGKFTKTTDYSYQRTANQRGLLTQRTYTTSGMTNGSGTTRYEYSGCQ
jgi:hypothetical protein